MRKGETTKAAPKGLNNIYSSIYLDKKVYFENCHEEIAYRYEPNGNEKFGRFFAKYYGSDEYEVFYTDSECLFKTILKDKIISKSRYENYHLIEGVFCNNEY
jgi:hypothetical protein